MPLSCNLFNQDDEEEEEEKEKTLNYTVSFYDMQPSSYSSGYETKYLSSQTVEDGKTVSKPADPVDKWGRTFLGWFEEKYIDTDGDNIAELSYIVFDFTTIINSHKELYAKWDGDLVPVYFDLEDGTTPNDYASDGYDYVSKSYYGDYAIYAVEGKSIKAPTAPVKEGYKFIGWTFDTWGTVNLFDFDTVFEKSDSTYRLYAYWVASDDTSNHIVTFDSNGGSNVQTKVTSYSITEPDEPTRDGYIFAGWYSDTEFTTKYVFNTYVTSNMTLYAKWIRLEESCIVKFETYCSDTIDDRVLTKGDIIGVVKSLYRNGYTFKGWYTDSNFENVFTDFTAPIYSDTTLYAKWIVTVPDWWLRLESIDEDYYYIQSITVDGQSLTLDSNNSLRFRFIFVITPGVSYKIYYSKSNDTSSAIEAKTSTIISKNTGSIAGNAVYIPNFTAGTYYFWVKAFLSNGDESDFSEVATYTKE